MNYRCRARRICARLSILTLAVTLCATTFRATVAAELEFPFDSELLYDARPMKGSKQVPSLDIGPRGQASIKL